MNAGTLGRNVNERATVPPSVEDLAALGAGHAAGDFLSGVTFPLAIAGLVLGLSYVVKHSASLLDLDIVRATLDGPEESDFSAIVGVKVPNVLER